MATTFGAFLTELRENARVIQEQENLILDVETEMICAGHHNPRKAYAAVVKRRANSEEKNVFADGDSFREETARPTHGPADGSDGPWDADEDDDFDPFEEAGPEISKEERHALFEDFMRSIPGVDPGDLSKAEYTRLFAEFEAELFGKRPEGPRSQLHDGKKSAPARDEDRLKEIYRILVRRLHPDLRADGDATVSAIWHEVQEAYEARNLDRLETLLAFTEMESGAHGGKASLSQMRAAQAELRRAFQAIQRSIGEAKRDPAWGFSRTPYHGPMEKRLRREMEEDLSAQRWALADLKRILDVWSRPWRPPVKKPKQAQKAKAGQKSNTRKTVQTELFEF
jgi:hypothetical protein